MNIIREIFRILLRKYTNVYAWACIYFTSSSFENMRFLRYIFDIIASRDTAVDYPAVFRARTCYLKLYANDEKNCEVKNYKSDM